MKFRELIIPIIIMSLLLFVVMLAAQNRVKFPPAEILGKSAYISEGRQVYEIRTYHGYHKLTKDKYEKYNVGDKYE